MANPSLRRALGLEGWGPNHDQPNPLIKFGQRIATDVQGARDEPEEFPYRVNERLKEMFPGAQKFRDWGQTRQTTPDKLQYREGDYTDEPLGAQPNPLRAALNADSDSSPNLQSDWRRKLQTEVPRTGVTEPGNLDPYNRPIYKHPNDSGYGTTESFSGEFDEDGREILIPRIVNGQRLSEQEAIDHYRKTKEHFGKFAAWQDADKYAESLHNSQDAYLRSTRPDLYTESQSQPSNPLRSALSNDTRPSIQPDYRTGGNTSPTANLPPLPVMARNSGRPTRDRSLDRDAQEPDYQDRLEEYKPQNEGLGKTILKSAVGLIGGVSSAASPWLNRDRTDRNWRDHEIARSENKQDRGNALRRATLSEDYIKSQTAENNAQADAADRDRTKYDWFPQDTDGDGIPDTEVYSPVRTGSSRQVFKKAAADRVPIRGSVVEGGVKYQTEYDPETKRWVKSLGADGNPIVEADAPKPEKPTVNYSQRANWYYKKQSEAEAQAKDLRQQADNADLTTYAGQKSQEDLLKRAGEAEKNAQTYRDKGDDASTEPPSKSAPSTHGFSVSAWLQSHPGKTESDAMADHAANYSSYKVVP